MKSKKLTVLTGLAATALVVVACGSSSIDKYLSQGTALARVGNTKITEGYLKLLEKINPGIKNQIDNPQGKKRIVDNLIEQEMLYQESVAKKLDQLQSVKEKVDLYKRVIVAQALLEKELDNKAADYYDKNKEKEFERIKVSHIFFSTQPSRDKLTPGKAPPPPPSDEELNKLNTDAQAKAKAAYDKLKAGEEWNKVVAENTDDKVSSEKGGDFGYLSPGDRRIERLDYKGLVDAAFKMKKDEYSEPIKAKDGWHILKVEGEKETQTFDEVEAGIKFKLKGEVKGLVMAELKKKLKVEYLDLSLQEDSATPAPSAVPPPPAAAKVPSQEKEKK